ncbi:ATP-binding protein [Candidatus Woesearchaeota archaeon]|nr:ATP-binding protein [Candidatus Woesearchaeota archaeon]
MSKVIGVTGGKGGTGKSTVATALAVELAKKSKVLLVDMDVECPNDHLILSINRKQIETVFQRIPKFDFEKCIKCGLCGQVCKTNAIVGIKDKNPIFIQEQCNGCGACFVKCPVKAISWSKKEIGKVYSGRNYNLAFLSGELKIREPVSEFVVDAIKEILEKKEQDYEYIILDTAAGTHCDVISALGYCDFVFAVTEPTPLGEHDCELIIELLLKLKKPYEIILNRYEKENEHILSKMLEKYNKKIFAKIPYKREIMVAYSKGVPIEDENIREIGKEVERW